MATKKAKRVRKKKAAKRATGKRATRPKLRPLHPRGRGRPTNATAFTLFRVLLARKEGVSIRYCGGPAGIHQATLAQWMKRAEQMDEAWQGRSLIRSEQRAYMEMDGTLQELADIVEAHARASQTAEEYSPPDYSGVTDFEVTHLGHWLSWLDQWTAVTAQFVGGRAMRIAQDKDWRAHAWLLERFDPTDYGQESRLGIGMGSLPEGTTGEVNVALRIEPPKGRDDG